VYTFWELSQPGNKAHLDRLFEETKSGDYDSDDYPVSYTAIDKMDWLECCIREGLRLHTPSGHIQARVVPKGGAMIAGYMIPENVRFAACSYMLEIH
jgi:hypothetical protein